MSEFWRQAVNLFRIRREERMATIIAMLAFSVLNALNVVANWSIQSGIMPEQAQQCIKRWHLAGFDPITYSVMTDWSSGYNIYRHPLLAYFVWPFSKLNEGLMALTGCNCAILITAILLVFFATYSFVFLTRIFHETIGTRRSEAYVLATLNFSFAYVMLSTIAPDHFGVSMFCLILTLYLCSRKLQRGSALNWWQTIIMFFFTAGISLNNGLKIFLAALVTRRKRFFRPGYLVIAVIIPAAIMWGSARWSYHHFVWPKEMARKEKVMQKRKAMGLPPKPLKHKAPRNTGKPLMQGEFMRWTDITTNRWDVATEGLFGEGIMLHEDYLLGDVLVNRPIIVKYRNWFNYVIEGLLILLFVGGIWRGRRSLLLWTAMSFFLMDMALHMGLGFGINEISIMSAHYLYVLPICMAYLLVGLNDKWRKRITTGIEVIASYLVIWNVTLLVEFLFF